MSRFTLSILLRLIGIIALGAFGFLLLDFYVPSAGHYLKDNYEGIVAVVALLLAIDELHSTRRHNRLSVRPALEIYRIYERPENTRVCRFELHNNGLGPSVIRNYRVFVDKAEVSGGQDRVVKAFASCLDKNYSHRVRLMEVPTGVYVMKAGEHMCILDVELPPPPPPFTELDVPQLDAMFSRIEIVVEYESLYAEPFSIRESLR